MSFPQLRLRRLRRTRAMREIMSETKLDPVSLIAPIFVDERVTSPTPIESMPGQSRLPINAVSDAVAELSKLGIKAVILFGIPSRKDALGSEAYSSDGVVQRSLRGIKDDFGDEIVLIADTCLCEYTSHGHCGVIERDIVDNDRTLDLLSKIAVNQIESGADIVAPSGMIDGQVAAIRRALDKTGFQEAMIMSYSSKQASAFYGPFRDAAESTPQFGNRRAHQMSFRNLKEAMREIALDINEGADIILIKPALACLDIIAEAYRRFDHPIAAYNVSGEYAMVKAASEKGWLDERVIAVEVLTAVKRAGANLIITYHAKDFAKWYRDGIEF